MKIFISHSSKDKDYGEALVDLLRGIEIKNKQITFTSRVVNGVPIGKNIFDWLRKKLSCKSHDLFILSPDYYKSTACKNEMGASWALNNKKIVFFIPEFDLDSYDFRNGAIDPRGIAIDLENKDRIFEFAELINKRFRLKNEGLLLSQEVDKFLAKVAKIKKDRLENTEDKNAKQLSNQITSDTPKKEDLDEDEMTLDEIVDYVQSLLSKNYEGEVLDDHLEIMCFNSSNEDKEVEMFKQLWQLVFKNEDELSVDLRWARYEILDFLFNKNKERCTALIGADLKYFNTVSDLDQCLRYLIKFLKHNAYLYPKFELVAGVSIRNFVGFCFDEKIYAWFLSESYPEHLKKLERYIPYHDLDFSHVPAISFIIKIGYDMGYPYEVAHFITELSKMDIFSSVYQHIYKDFITPNLSDFNEEQLNQICDRINYYESDTVQGKHRHDISKFKNKIYSKYPNFDLSKYPNLFRKI